MSLPSKLAHDCHSASDAIIISPPEDFVKNFRGHHIDPGGRDSGPPFPGPGLRRHRVVVLHVGAGRRRGAVATVCRGVAVVVWGGRPPSEERGAAAGWPCWGWGWPTGFAIPGSTITQVEAFERHSKRVTLFQEEFLKGREGYARLPGGRKVRASRPGTSPGGLIFKNSQPLR